MWTSQYSKVYSGIKKEVIWSLWADVNNWTSWHSDLDYCKMDGPFEVGNHFILKPNGVKPFKILITEVDKWKKFTDCTTFFGAKMYDTHSIEETEEGLKLTNTLVVTGPLKWLWVKIVAQNVANSAPNEMDSLVNLARKQ